ncbi:uncharacterized protein V6R79_025993 [Siganus canaliculatus]
MTDTTEARASDPVQHPEDLFPLSTSTHSSSSRALNASSTEARFCSQFTLRRFQLHLFREKTEKEGRGREDNSSERQKEGRVLLEEPRLRAVARQRPATRCRGNLGVIDVPSPALLAVVSEIVVAFISPSFAASARSSSRSSNAGRSSPT